MPSRKSTAKEKPSGVTKRYVTRSCARNLDQAKQSLNKEESAERASSEFQDERRDLPLERQYADETRQLMVC